MFRGRSTMKQSGKIKTIIIMGLTALLMLMIVPAAAGDIPADDVDFVRNLLLAIDPDFTLFDEEGLFNSLTWLIENDCDERVVHNAVTVLQYTGDDRSVEYIAAYLDEIPMDCLYALGFFSTPESCDALLAYIEDDDEFNRRFAVQSLGELDFAVSEEMWEIRAGVLDRLELRISAEEEEWIIPFIENSFESIYLQELDPDALDLKSTE